MEFFTGANYWASNAGTDMYINWDESVIEDDFRRLKENNVNSLRVFISWRDFQPVTALYTSGNRIKEFVMPDHKMPKNPWYLDETMLDRFEFLCDLSEKYGFSLIVGLVTGWMSGRLFMPPALDGRNVFTDPLCIKFQIKLVTGIVQRFKNKPAIYAWDLGNECNCMSSCPDSETAYNWSMLIANTIRANDPTRPVISGMHGLYVDNNPWLISDQGESTDVLTTHPYAYFVRFCENDPIDSIRTLMHGTCETLFYAHLSQKPCLCEELGTLSKNICSDAVSARFMRVNLLSGWAHGTPGVLWWGANEQSHLEEPPYTWCTLERELGMFDKDNKPKEYMLEMKRFAEFLKKNGLSAQKLPETDCGIILTRNSDQWGQGYMSFTLLKQIGLEPEFIAPNAYIPEKKAYVLPSTHGDGCMYKETYMQLKERVAEGATLYVSNADAFFTELYEFFGFSIHHIEGANNSSGSFTLNGKALPYTYGQRRILTPITAKVLAYDEGSNPILLENSFGLGKVIFLNFPMEDVMLSEGYAFDKGREEIYLEAFKDLVKQKPVNALNNKAITVINENTVTVINFSDKEIDPQVVFNGVSVDKILYGDLNKLNACEGCIFTIK